MEERVGLNKMVSEAFRAQLVVEKALSKSSIEKPLQELIKLRVSQINSCAFCLDMHWKDARAAGETEQRLYGVAAWKESPYYSDRERAGLLLAEELTRLSDRSISEVVHEKVREVFDTQELADLVWVIATINTWNRVNVGLKTRPGGYQPQAITQLS